MMNDANEVKRKIDHNSATKYEIWWYWCRYGKKDKQWVPMPDDWDGTLDQLMKGDIAAGIPKRGQVELPQDRPVETPEVVEKPVEIVEERDDIF